jgi:kanamycin kinase
MQLACRAVEEETIDLLDLDDERAGWTSSQLWDAVVAARPSTEDVVVCHGDLCPPNIVIDPKDLSVAGLIDIARLGTADRYADLALATRSISSEILNPQYGPEYAERFLTRYGEETLDHARVDFYRLLDEFF